MSEVAIHFQPTSFWLTASEAYRGGRSEPKLSAGGFLRADTYEDGAELATGENLTSLKIGVGLHRGAHEEGIVGGLTYVPAFSSEGEDTASSLSVYVPLPSDEFDRVWATLAMLGEAASLELFVRAGPVEIEGITVVWDNKARMTLPIVSLTIGFRIGDRVNS